MEATQTTAAFPYKCRRRLRTFRQSLLPAVSSSTANHKCDQDRGPRVRCRNGSPPGNDNSGQQVVPIAWSITQAVQATSDLGPWRIRLMLPTQKQHVEVAVTPVVPLSVTDEHHPTIPRFDNHAPGWARGSALKRLVAGNCTTPGAWQCYMYSAWHVHLQFLTPAVRSCFANNQNQGF